MSLPLTFVLVWIVVGFVALGLVIRSLWREWYGVQEAPPWQDEEPDTSHEWWTPQTAADREKIVWDAIKPGPR